MSAYIFPAQLNQQSMPAATRRGYAGRLVRL